MQALRTVFPTTEDPHALLISIFDGPDDFDEPDPERLRACAYWRCGELFEARTANQSFCRKACRSRQRRWERALERRARSTRGRIGSGDGDRPAGG